MGGEADPQPIKCEDLPFLLIGFGSKLVQQVLQSVPNDVRVCHESSLDISSMYMPGLPNPLNNYTDISHVSTHC